MEQLPASLAVSLPAELQGGDSAKFTVKIAKVNLVDGSEVSVAGIGVTAVVGPNNAGKSTFLREIHQHLQSEYFTSTNFISIGGLALAVSGGPADLTKWLAVHSRFSSKTGHEGFQSINAQPVKIDLNWLSQQLPSSFSNAFPIGKLGAALTSFLVHYADTQNRLTQSNPAPVREDAAMPAAHPVHVLAESFDKREAANALATEVFGESISIDTYSAANRIRVGEIDAEPPVRGGESEDRYLRELTSLPELSEQGDGMRSFFGLMLPLIAGTYPIVIVDEPEAFLHPPQAAALGRALGKIAAENGLQVILATHDRHLLAGLLESRVDPSVVRIDRQSTGPSGKVKQIDSTELAGIWDEPALRYSNALDGLFHRLVVLVEAEGDAKFFSAVIDNLDDPLYNHVSAGETLFVPCGGKGGMAKLASALMRLGIPVVVSPDLDVLEKVGELKAIVTSLDGTWSSFESDYNLAVSKIEKTKSSLTVRDLTNSLGDPDATLTEDHEKAIRRYMKTTAGGWAQVKAGGQKTLGAGGVGAAAERLLNGLAEVGIVPLRAGELESLAPTLGTSKGPAWNAEAFNAGVHKTDEARDHVRRLFRSGLERRK